jgi:branched-subunit amino acid ABC-type transport system permease component
VVGVNVDQVISAPSSSGPAAAVGGVSSHSTSARSTSSSLFGGHQGFTAAVLGGIGSIPRHVGGLVLG